MSAAVEEAEFSAYIIRSPHISFLLASSSLVDIPLSSLALNTPTFATLNGTYAPYTLPSPLPPIPHLPVLGLPGTCPSCPPPAPRRRTFTDYGLTRPVELRWGQYEGDVWFAREHATSYDPPMRSLRQRGWDVYVGRYEGGGAGVWERIEPPRAPVEVPVLLPPAREEKGEEDEHHATAQQNVHSEPQGKGKGEDKVKSNAKKSKPARKTEPRSASVQPTSATAPPATYLLREGLYIHWFHQKHAAWFPGPAITPVQDRGMGVGRTLMSVFKEGAEVWEGGEVVWRSG
ncbi:hypothetical protein CALCODRAFT_494933 [Calocera cornea HHB12733]|uniref:Uncharacterized protein n=1 Tax=Calocera cornea HHB12733 TaxID=1353952 RepID=A0A165GT20_9BASI|nr:hypothetical protein CALCODRAFT_494933 [Calocera cornea HHB12733]